MDVIIPAGGIPRPNHPIYKYTQGKPKALLDIAGKPMIRPACIPFVDEAHNHAIHIATNSSKNIQIVGRYGSY
jgi:NDP-sugar pyrophosphorylase family protein